MPDFTIVLPSLLNGITTGALYALVALGLTLIYGVLHIINFAHGALLMIGLYAVYFLNVQFGVDPYVALLIVPPLMFALGYALFLRVDATPYVFTFLPTIMLLGLGFALGYAALSVQATAGVSDHEQGLAAGLVQTSFQMGGAIVLAAVSAVVGEGTISDYRTAIAIVLGVAVLSLVLALAGVVRARTDEVVVSA